MLVASAGGSDISQIDALETPTSATFVSNKIISQSFLQSIKLKCGIIGAIENSTPAGPISPRDMMIRPDSTGHGEILPGRTFS